MPPRKKIAIVGGGITGAMAATTLCGDFEVEVFDQGRRGAGGRASHRAVAGGEVLADDPPIDPDALEFDHGCQFTRADTPRMRSLIESWVAAGMCAPWEGRLGRASPAPTSAPAPASPGSGDFFGVPSDPSPVFVGVGGMHALVRRVLAGSAAAVRRGVRVSGMERAGDGTWTLVGVGGEAAFHDSAESDAAAAEKSVLGGGYAAVLLTDVSSSFGGWHRASAGVPDAFSAAVRDRARIPLFSCMVAFASSLGLPLDGLTFDPAGPLWFAARSDSKPGFRRAPGGGGGGRPECWTLVSTPAFAVGEIGATPMQDPLTGAFLPQEDAYLNGAGGPSDALARSFLAQAAPMMAGRGGDEAPEIVHLQGQRWGSALPAPAGVGGRDARGHGPATERVMGVAYEASTPQLVYPRPDTCREVDYLADDSLGLFYAGDFCSARNPGFEAAALSGVDAAEHMREAVRG